jgi:hypothetical protein
VVRRNGEAPATDRAVNRGQDEESSAKRTRPDSPKPNQSSIFAVCDGRVCLGHVLSRGKLGFEAFDSEDKSIGTFDTLLAATRALPGRAR